MALSWEKFLYCANNFLSISNSICDGWSIFEKENSKPSPENYYLMKKDVKFVTSNTITFEHCNTVECEENLGSDSLSSDSSFNNPADKFIWEYHILYSPSYSVPVLYFNVWNTAGKLLPLEEIWATLKVPKEVLSEKWSFVSQQEHPMLLRPFYFLHPCKSIEILKVSENSKVNPLVTWLSSIAHIVHLSLPNEYGKEVDIESLGAYLYKQAFIIPGSVFMNVLAGALFGVLKGFPLCCVLTASGATACFLMSRTFGSSVLQRYFPAQIKFLQEKVNQNSDRLVYYLLFLRLFPMSPNWLINLLSPIVGVPLHIFFFTVLVGLMPYNFLCVQAGGMLATLRSMDDVLSFTTLLQLAAMAVVALGPSFILKSKQSFKDSFNTSTESESKKSS